MKWLLATLLVVLTQTNPTAVKPVGFTAAVTSDADDPAIWVNALDPSKSVIYGTDKVKAPTGGIYAFDLSGKVLQHIDGIDRPNNCDVEYGLRTPGQNGMDLLVVSERKQGRLRIFGIDRGTGKLTDVSGETRVFPGESGGAGEPMGVACYRHKDGEIFAIVSRPEGPADGYLGQYRLAFNATTNKVDVKEVRRFGKFSGKKEIESICVDDELGYVYYSDETFGTRKYHADPDKPSAGAEVAVLNTEGFQGDHEGIAIYDSGKGTGFLICTDQVRDNSVYHLYDRVTNKPLGSFSGGVDDTDGIDVCSAPLGPRFPKGLFVAMNSGSKNFAIFDWLAVTKAIKQSSLK